MESLDKLREWLPNSLMPRTCEAACQAYLDEIEREIEDRIDDLMATSVDGYPEPFNTPDAMHMILGTAADNFETPQDAVHYLQGYTSMELPLDADNVPIHVGDKIQYHGGEPLTVCAVAPGVIHVWAVVKLGERNTTYHYEPIQCTHYKPRTVEDVLLDAIERAAHPGNEWIEIIADCADEIRELLGVDE